MTTYTKTELKSIIREVLLQEFWGRKEGDIFTGLKALDQKGAEFDEYMQLLSPLQAMGKGSSRVVFAVDDDIVIKLQKPGRDNQNEYESDPQLQSLFGNYMPKVFEVGDDFGWIAAERVVPVGNRNQEVEWLKKAGLGDVAERGLEMYDIAMFLEDFHNVFSEIETEMGPEALEKVNIEKVFQSVLKSTSQHSDSKTEGAWNFTLEDLKRWAENPIINLISRAKKDHGSAVGDIGLGNIGFGSDGRPVILDLGLSQDHFDDDW